MPGSRFTGQPSGREDLTIATPSTRENTLLNLALVTIEYPKAIELPVQGKPR